MVTEKHHQIHDDTVKVNTKRAIKSIPWAYDYNCFVIQYNFNQLVDRPSRLMGFPHSDIVRDTGNQT